MAESDGVLLAVDGPIRAPVDLLLSQPPGPRQPNLLIVLILLLGLLSQLLQGLLPDSLTTEVVELLETVVELVVNHFCVDRGDQPLKCSVHV